jgi:adenosylcobinamide kinase/adenosylcobinamide-phosphate guanylyltransferase
VIKLVIGGARSGKSSYALAQAEASGSNLIFIATARASDEEMADRIRRHQQERGDNWTLIEEPFHLAARITEFGKPDQVLIDCLTLWTSNWLCTDNPDGWKQEKQSFLAGIQRSRADIMMVTNEVGMGIVPMGQLSRQFIDQSGWLHQAIAAIADQVILVTVGIPRQLKEPLNKS